MREPDDSGGPRDDAGALGGIPEALKRAFSAGLPKEAVDYLRSQASQTKQEAARIVAREIREFLEKADLPELARQVLANLKMEVKVEVRFVPAAREAGAPPAAERKARKDEREK